MDAVDTPPDLCVIPYPGSLSDHGLCAIPATHLLLIAQHSAIPPPQLWVPLRGGGKSQRFLCQNHAAQNLDTERTSSVYSGVVLTTVDKYWPCLL